MENIGEGLSGLPGEMGAEEITAGRAAGKPGLSQGLSTRVRTVLNSIGLGERVVSLPTSSESESLLSCLLSTQLGGYERMNYPRPL